MRLFPDLARSTLADAIASDATSATLASGTSFGTTTGDEYVVVTLTDSRTAPTVFEEVAATIAGDVLTLTERGRAGTQRAWPAGSHVFVGMTGSALEELQAAIATSASNLTSGLAGKAATVHTHAIADVTSLQGALDAKAASSHSHAQSDVTGLTAALGGKADSAHTHAQSDVTGLVAALAAKADDAATTSALAGKAAASHTHAFADLTSKPTTLSGYGISDAASDSELASEASARGGADSTLAAAILDETNRAVAAESDLQDAIDAVGSPTIAAADITDATSAGRAVLTAADTAAQRSALGLGTAATTASTAYEAAGGIATHAALTQVHGISAFGATLVDDADASAARSTLGLVIGTNVQAQDAELAALAGLTSAANKVPYFTGSGTAALQDFTAAGRAIAGAADAAAQRTALGIGLSVLGYNTAGASEEVMTAWAVYMKQITPTTNGILLNIQAYVKHNTAGNLAGHNVAVFSDNAGEPDRLLAATTSSSDSLFFSNNVGDTSVYRWFGRPINHLCAAGTPLWIAVATSAAAPGRIAYDAGSDRTFVTTANYITDAGRFTVSVGARKYSMRADFLTLG